MVYLYTLLLLILSIALGSVVLDMITKMCSRLPDNSNSVPVFWYKDAPCMVVLWTWKNPFSVQGLLSIRTFALVHKWYYGHNISLSGDMALLFPLEHPKVYCILRRRLTCTVELIA